MITVVIPTFNRAPLLERSICSLLEQSYKDWELIVVDDGSTDDTGSVVGRFSQARYVYQQNQGVGAARNTGIALAKGEVISMLDSDDEYLPEHLESRLAILNDPADPMDLLAGGAEVMGSPVTVDYYDPGKLVELRNCVVGGSLFGRAEVFRDDGGFNNARFGEDTDFWVRAQRKFRTRFLQSPVTYRLHETPDSLRIQRLESWKPA